MNTITVTAKDFEMPWDEDHTFPFFETEDAYIIGYGHPDRAEFAASVDVYDTLCSGGPTGYETEVSDVQRLYGVVTLPEGSTDLDEWMISWSGVTAETPDAMPISVVIR